MADNGFRTRITRIGKWNREGAKDAKERKSSSLTRRARRNEDARRFFKYLNILVGPGEFLVDFVFKEIKCLVGLGEFLVSFVFKDIKCLVGLGEFLVDFVF